MENQNLDQQFNQNQQVPNATAVLVLGIISIVICWLYGLFGLACGIIALVLAGKGRKAYMENPGMYSAASYANLKAGRVCAIIGTILSGLYVLLVIIAFATVGTLILGSWKEIMDSGNGY
ncbi:MAG: CCC motif membrane protein [Chitinophagales bacterium]